MTSVRCVDKNFYKISDFLIDSLFFSVYSLLHQIERRISKMNIFASYECPIESAKAMCDKHVIKQILESAQMLCTAHTVLDGVQKKYKPTHSNHTCSIFVRQSKENYNWLYRHLQALCEEYSYRTGKVHATSSLLEELKTTPKTLVTTSFRLILCACQTNIKRLLTFTKNYRLYLAHKIKDWAERTEKRPIVAKMD